MKKGLNEKTGILSGLPRLDKITNGWQKSNFYIIASRPAIGKTSFALSLAKSAAINQQVPTALFTLEMSVQQLLKRLNMQEEGVASKAINGLSRIDSIELKEMEKGLNALSGAPLFVDDTPGLRITDFEDKAKKLVLEQGVRLIIVDYIQLMNGPTDIRGHREAEVAFIARSLKSLTKELDIPIIAMSQLSRTLGRGNYSVPELRDLQESLEEHSDLVILLQRPGFYSIFGEQNDIRDALFIVAKNRNGSLGKVPMNFDLDRLFFTETNKRLEDPQLCPHQKKTVIDSSLNAQYTLDNFSISECNNAAVQVFKEMIEEPGACKHNPIILIGDYGSGKTHLVNAVGNAFTQRHPGKTVLYVSAIDFFGQYIDAFKSNRVADFRSFYNKVDLLIFDNIQDLGGEGSKNSFFYIIDSMHQKGKQIVLTSGIKYKELKKIFSKRFFEHLSWGKIVEIRKIGQQSIAKCKNS